MIIVCPLHRAPALAAEHKVSAAISLLSPDTPFPTFASLASQQHLRLSLHDITAVTPDLREPQNNDAVKLMRFIEKWDRAAPMLIHCWAGVSRSTAAAYIAMCMLRDENEDALAQELRDASPSATPNRLLVTYVDHMLGREGRMIKAIERIGRGADAFEGNVFELTV